MLSNLTEILIDIAWSILACGGAFVIMIVLILGYALTIPGVDTPEQEDKSDKI